MIDLSKAPDIAATRQRLQSEWQERDAHITQMRDLRFMASSVDVPAAMEAEIVKTPVAYQLVQNMVGTLMADPLTIKVPPATQTEKAQAASSKIEAFTTVALEAIQRTMDEDVIERYVECLIADGHACMRCLYAPQLWQEFPTRGKDEDEEDYNKRTDDWKHGRPLPIALTWVDPLSVYPVWGELGLEAVLEDDWRDPLSLYGRADKFNLVKDRPELFELAMSKGENKGMVRFSQLWTKGSLTYAINDEVIHFDKNPQGIVPYVYTMGNRTSSRKRGRMGLSMLYPMQNLIPYLDRLLSQKASAIRIWCWPTPIVRVRPLAGDDPQKPRTIEIRPGQAVTLFEGEEISFLTWEGSGPDIDGMVGLIMNMIERAGLADSLYGIGSGESSGYAINQLIGAARMKFKPIVLHGERGIAQLCKIIWDIIEYQIGQEVFVYGWGKHAGWISLGPKDLKGYRSVEVNLNPLLPTDAYARSSKTINEVRAGLRSVRSGMEQVGIEDPEAERNQILVEQYLQSPNVQELLTREAVKKWGVIQRQGQSMALEELMEIAPHLPPALQQALKMAMMGMGNPNQAPGQPDGNQPGMPSAAVMAAPGVQAAPGAPAPNPASVGRQVRPSGIATGMAPGPERRG